MARPGGQFVYRPTNSQWLAGFSPPNEGLLNSGGMGPLQGYVDFDRLGPQFLIEFSGMVGSSSSTGIWRVRIGGTRGVVDGDIALEETYTASAFGGFSVSALVNNVWEGRQLVKLTGEGTLLDGNPFAQDPSLWFLPVAA